MPDDDTLEDLEHSWNDLLDDCEIPTSTPRREEFERVVAAYSEPHRVYHDLEHLSNMLSCLENQHRWIEDRASVSLAAWYHDVIYDPRSTENETRSAEVARLSLGALGFPRVQLDRVAALVLLTRNHESPEGDTDAEYFLDADLEVLGSPPNRYARYAEGIRQEYSFVLERDYCVGRRRVLQGFLERSSIFRVDRNRERLEASARVNIAAEITRLDQRRRALST